MKLSERPGYTFVSLVVGLVVSVSGSNAQDSLWSAAYGGYFNDNGYAATQLSNGDILLIGSTYSYGSGDHDVFLVRVDSAGTEIWSRTYGGTKADYGYDIAATSDGGFVIVGATSSYGSGGHDVYLLKINNVGSMVWSKTYGGTGDDRGASVRMTADSGFIICGTTASFGTGTDIYLIKTDSLGDSSWTATYGGSAGESGSAVRVAPDSGYVVIGSTGSYGTGYSSIYLVRTGAAGDTIWTATYGGVRADFGYAVETTNDKGFILAGATAPDGENFYDACLVKVDSLGILEWSQTYGGAYEDRGYSVGLTADGGYILAGTTEANGARKIDVYMVKADAGGNREWDSAYGGVEPDYGRMVLIDPQQDYCVVGYSYSTAAGGSDMYLLKIQGPVRTSVDGFEPGWPPDRFALSQNYPNPFNMETRIEFRLPRRSAYRLTIYNVLGQVIRRWDDEAFSAGWYAIAWDGRDETGDRVATGIYFYHLQADNLHETRKMVVLK